MSTIAEPTKVCAACKVRKPWSEFFAKVKWPDGTTRQPHSRCRKCFSAAANREPKRRYDRRRLARIRNNPQEWAFRLEEQRFRYRKRHGEARPCGRLGDAELIPAAPFAAWLRHVHERDDAPYRELAERFGVPLRVLTRIVALKDPQPMVQLATVERALIADDTITLRELYPDLYEGQAALGFPAAHSETDSGHR